MVKDGVFGFGSGGIGYGEHLIDIKLQFRDFIDEIQWDICNPDNSPEEFAAQMVQDLCLQPAQIYVMAIAC
jgi:hypothetical protein